MVFKGTINGVFNVLYCNPSKDQIGKKEADACHHLR